MVMDIRQTWSGDGEEDKHQPSAQPAADSTADTGQADPVSSLADAASAGLVTADPTLTVPVSTDPIYAVPEPADPEPGIDLAELIQQVATGDAQVRAQAAAELRALVPGHDGIELLFDLAGPSDDPRRLPAWDRLRVPPAERRSPDTPDSRHDDRDSCPLHPEASDRHHPAGEPAMSPCCGG
mgnify:CR=1 FL=1